MVIKFKDKTNLEIKNVILKLPYVWVVCDTKGRFYLINAKKIFTEKEDEKNKEIQL
jgi:hypothetical protein